MRSSFSSVKFVEIASLNRAISSLLSELKSLKITKTCKYEAINSLLVRLKLVKNSLKESNKVIAFWSQIRENNQKSGKKFTPVRSQIHQNCQKFSNKFISLRSSIGKIAKHREISNKFFWKQICCEETEIVPKLLRHISYPKRFEKQCPDLKLSMASHHIVPYRIVLCCVVLCCVVFLY